MNLITENYPSSLEHLPHEGKHIIAHTSDTEIVVYQAYKPSIAEWSAKHQQLGGPDFSYNRMSWIKPNFLWMMFRCGWASKENQERVLALWLRRTDFENILSAAVKSTFDSSRYGTEAAWKQAVLNSDVRLQWDPDHDPYGRPITRRAVQLGLRGDILKTFGKAQLTRIEDITPFVQEQKQWVEKHQLDHLLIPRERVYHFSGDALRDHIGADKEKD